MDFQILAKGIALAGCAIGAGCSLIAGIGPGTYNELCRKCQHGCTQSFRAVVIDCPRYLSKRAKKKDDLLIG